MDTIGERLAYTRINILSMSQSQLAQILNISQGALSQIEKNKRGLSMETIIKLMEYSKTNNLVSCCWILTGEQDTILPTTNINNLTDDEKELLNTYKILDRRGQHRVHTIIYEELDRMQHQKENP